MDKVTAISKIRKCMALARSSQPHEAAAALRQAQKLMERFGIENPEVLAAGVGEHWARSCATKVAPRYEVVLASAVARSFGCDFLFVQRANPAATRIDGGYAFIGVSPAADVAAYVFGVLVRQLRPARIMYMRTALKRHSKTKTAAADAFCLGWVYAVRDLIAAVVPSPEQTEAIEAYKRAHYAVTTQFKPRDRTTPDARTLRHAIHGIVAGQDAQLHLGVGADHAAPQLEAM